MPKEEAEKRYIKERRKDRRAYRKAKRISGRNRKQSREKRKRKIWQEIYPGNLKRARKIKRMWEHPKSAESLSQEEQAIYKEESDLRKAERKSGHLRKKKVRIWRTGIGKTLAV